MAGKHAILSPSSASRWVACPPSARLNEKLIERFGDAGSPFAEEGTKAHELGEIKLRKANGEINDFVYRKRRETLGDIPKEMEDATDFYAETVLGKLFTLRRTDPGARLYIEQRLDMTNWVPGCFGTGDAILVSDSVLEVCDLKYGKGVPVSAVGNKQARLYGLGGVQAFQALFSFQTVRNTIIQPRLDSVTEEAMSLQQLLEWGEEIRPVAKLAWEGKGAFRPGDHCRFCKAKAICSARVAEAMRIFEQGASDVATIPDEQIPDILAHLDTFEAWAKDLRSYALSQAMRGVQFKGYILTHGRRPGRKWKNQEEVVDQLSRAGLTEKEYMKTELRSPSEIEKLMGKTGFNAVLSDLVYQGDGKLELMPEDCGRVAYDPAELAFADLAEGGANGE